MPLRMLLLIFWTTLCAAQTSDPICVPPPKPVREPDSANRVKDVQTFKTWFTKDQQTGRLIRGKPELERYPTALPDDPNNKMVVEYECDGPTRIKEVRYRRSKDPSFKKTVYSYDDNGLKTEQADYFADGSLERLDKYKYDEKGNLIEQISKSHVHPGHFTPKRHDVYTTTRLTYEYDSKRNRTSQTLYRTDGSVYARWVYEYDSRNNLIKDTRRDSQGRLEDQYFYKYDRHNRLVEEKHYANFCVTRNNEFCKGTVNSGDGVFYYLTKINYEYDRRGNWIRQRQFSMGGESGSQRYQPDHILIRRFVYY